MGTVYLLTFPNGKQYVGQTSNDPAKRFAGHKAFSKKGFNLPVYNAWRKHGAPTMEILETVIGNVLCEAERNWILLLGTQLPGGYNITEGGEGAPMTERTKALLREAHLGKTLSPEHRAKLSVSRRAYQQPREVIEKSAASRRGRPRNPEVSAKIKAALTPEGRHNQIEALRRSHREGLIDYAKIAAKTRGQKRSPEQRAKLSVAKLLEFQNPERRAKATAVNRKLAAARFDPTSPRNIALAAGERYYFDGVPCPKGHVSKRRTRCRTCYQCYLEYNIRRKIRTRTRKGPYIPRRRPAQILSSASSL